MTKGTFAKEELMEEYLTSMLTDVTPGDPVQRDAVSKLLEKAQTGKVTESPGASPEVIQQAIEESKENQLKVDKEISAEKTMAEPPEEAPAAQQGGWYEQYREQPFQAMFFEVAGLTLAVPLTQLGGIHQLDKVGPLFGKPDWFKGVMLHRDEKFSVVDTARWVMPEKYNEKLAESLNYQYLIMLDESSWGLACEKLVNTQTLQPEDIKWREMQGKRPWLAGMVKEKMCALVNVTQLIALLDRGLDSNEH